MSALVRVPARAALLGNPSDLFGGATVALTIDELGATVRAERADGVTLESDAATISFADPRELVAAGDTGAYPEGPLALMMAAAKRYSQRGAAPAAGGYRLALAESTIPPRVGLAGSSAIVVATLRALGELTGDPVPEAELPAFALACETEELGIAAGPQDRVVQAVGGLLFMEFGDGPAAWRHERLDPALRPPLFVAWRAAADSHSGAAHEPVRARFERGEGEVVEAMEEIASLARAGLGALRRRDYASLGGLMARNFELRRRVYALDPLHVELVEVARAFGFPANYAGSGGAIVALATDRTRGAAARAELERMGCEVLVPGTPRDDPSPRP